MKITKKQNQEEWKELCSYIKKYILRYDDTKVFPTKMALRLKGLAQGREYVDKKFEQIHPYSLILKIFKALKTCIIEIVDKTEIKNEEHLVNLIMKIVWEKFNDIIDTYRKTAKREQEMLKRHSDDNIIVVNNNSNYVSKERKVKNDW